MQKYSAFVLTQISRITPPVSPQMRGARDRHERAVRCDGRGWRARRTRLKRTAKSCGSGVAVLALSSREASPAGDGGKRAVLREEHEVSRKAIAQGRPECSRCPVCSCAVLFAQIARETAGAASTRSSLRPLFRGPRLRCKPRAHRAARSRTCVGSLKLNPKALPSSLRTQGPIATGRNCFVRSVLSVFFNNNGRGVWVPAFAGTTAIAPPPNLKTPYTRHRSQNNPPYDTTTPCS